MCNESKTKLFNYLWNEIDAAYHEAALKLGLSDSAMIILSAVCANGDECLLSEVTSNSGISKQTINSSLRKLEADDIIFLEAVGSRKKKICLTKKGKDFVKNTVFKVIEIENNIYNSWSQEECSFYYDLSRRFLDDFRREISKL